MPTRACCLAVLLLLVVGQVGCGTLNNFLWDFPGTPFGGVQTDIGWMATINPFIMIAAIIDTPFSLVADVLFLPITLIFGS